MVFKYKKNKNKKSFINRIFVPFKSLLKEFKLIEWCRPKTWLKSFIIVILLGSVSAVILSLFDLGLEAATTFISSYSLNLNGTARTVMQIAIFIFSVILAILCFLQSNKGESVLNAFTAKNSPLFESGSAKEYGSDKLITKIISLLFIVIIVLTLVEGLLG